MTEEQARAQYDIEVLRALGKMYGVKAILHPATTFWYIVPLDAERAFYGDLFSKLNIVEKGARAEPTRGKLTEGRALRVYLKHIGALHGQTQDDYPAGN